MADWERWADSVLAMMSLRARIAQMIMRPVTPTGDVERWIVADSIGGVVMPFGPLDEVAQRARSLQAMSGIPLLVAADMEELPPLPLMPGARPFPLLLALTAASAGTNGCDYGRLAARVARGAGVHWLFPPGGVDAADPPGERPADPPRRDAFGAPFISCADDDGLLAGVRPAVGDGDDLEVLSLSGVETAPTEVRARVAIDAIDDGTHLLVVDRDHRLIIQAIMAAVRDARLTDARIDSAVRRLLILKARLGLGRSPPVDADQARQVIALARSDTFAVELERQSIVLARDGSELVPIDTTGLRRVLVLSWLDDGLATTAERRPSDALVAELRALLEPGGVTVESTLVSGAPSAGRRATLASRAGGADLLVLASFVAPRPGSVGRLPASAERLFEAALARQPKAIIVSFGEPRIIRQLPDTGSYLIAWNPWSSSAERAVARALVGDASIFGRLPIDLGRRMPRGAGIAMQSTRSDVGRVHRDEATIARLRDTLQGLLDQAVLDSAFPGAVAVVGSADGILASATAGMLDWTPSPRPDMGTLWDIASLTKVVGLTSAVMRLVEAGTLDLDAPVQQYLPEWTGPGKDRVAVRDLLTHTTGLPAFRRLFLETTDRDSLIAMVLETPLDTVPGARMVYSDFGLIIAGEIVQNLAKQPLDRHLARTIFEPLGMHETLYRPPPGLLARVAPTEFDPWRGVQVRGEVHDENTAAMGGVSAHAGLFSTARDLSRFARMYLNRGTLDGVQLVSPRTISLFTRVQDPALSHRAIGWETPNGVNSAGHRLSSVAFGHTGFTGTSLWIDPANDVFVLLLSNRVNPSRENRRVYDLRGLLADTVIDVLAPSIPSLATASPSAFPSPSPSPPTP